MTSSHQHRMIIESASNGFIVIYNNGSETKVFKTTKEAFKFIDQYIQHPWEQDNE